MQEQLEHLIGFIERKVALRDEDNAILEKIVRLESFQKGDELVRFGETCTKLRFVISGIYRAYKLEDGKEITSYFNYQNRNPFVASFVSLLTKEPSDETVECIEDGALLTINYSDWLDAYATSERLNTFGRVMAELNYVLAMERIEALQFHTATDRYEAFIKHYPQLLNLIPHHYIASYIGVAPESLSRIRKELAKNKS